LIQFHLANGGTIWEDEMNDALKPKTTEELLQLQREISEELSLRSGTIKIMLSQNPYKGTGKCWVAEIDENGKTLNFLTPVGRQKDGYKATKIFELQEGKRYRINDMGSKTYDERYDCVISDGQIRKV
jgi:hypothetical protein